MRLFIHKITYRWNEKKQPLYEFTNIPNASWFWESKEQAEQARRILENDGIVIDQQFGGRIYCEEFWVEQLPHGGFGISCAYPR
jgi:hypothetical protein